MRIISGEFKGRSLAYPKDKRFRPTQDRVKEAMFSILGAQVVDATVLDLCCGTGSLGLEALSRGATKLIMVDKSINYAKKNVETLQVEASVIKANIVTFLGLHETQYDLILLDPPYESTSVYERSLALIQEKQLLKPTGILMVEHGTQHPIPFLSTLEGKAYSYGDTQLTFIVGDALT